MRFGNEWMDRAGAAISTLCGLHCVLVSALLLAYPALWLRGEIAGLPLTWLRNMEWVLAVSALTMATIGLGSGWWVHRNWGPSSMGTFAAGLIVVGTLTPLPSPHVTSAIVLAGGFTLATAHLWNLRVARFVRQQQQAPAISTLR